MEQRFDRLRRIQDEIAKRVSLEDEFKKPVERVSGVDLAYVGNLAFAACVTMKVSPLEVLGESVLLKRAYFPYIPGFLGFREGPVMAEIISKMEAESDVFLINALGIAHPRFCGCASHVGILVQRPTIGVTASKLCGEYEYEPEKVGEWVPLVYSGRVVGAVLKSKEDGRPIFVSPGHMISFESSVKLVMTLISGHKLPEPLYRAHRLANERKRLEGRVA